MNVQHALLEAAERLRDLTEQLTPKLLDECDNIDWIYNPLIYAWAPHSEYIRRHGTQGAHTMLVGMNPGHGMGNTGVPFGCPKMVREVLGIVDLPVDQPPLIHPKRPIYGLEHPKPEVSGTRIWSALSEAFGTGNAPGKHVYIVNHCPLWMFNEKGTNITPDKLRGPTADRLRNVCDEHLREVANILNSNVIIGVGRYAQRRVETIFQGSETEVRNVPHPSPANPFANRNGGADWRVAFRTVLGI
ncbi:MAG: single-stranded DNA-binding protein [Candidatus Poseidoniales archaeon]|nr:single-stranded DNA-binding protein [Euryarchaeota archaeon]RCH74551.1 MAG: single-stranded DNA-binding protein [Candidatus Poseidoniales archaeon]CAI8216154.1 MAG: Uncharacterised protein [Euryarchaeota archaeon]